MIAFVVSKKIPEIFFLVRKISEKIIRGNSFFPFYNLSKQFQKFFSGLQKLRKKNFVCTRKIRKIFPARSIHALPRKTEFFPTTKKA